MKYDSTQDTDKHREKVIEFIDKIIKELQYRGKWHDDSKFFDPEKKIFDEYTPKLRDSKYGSELYKLFLSQMKEALDHHYWANRHHPEHFKNGMNEMNLVDIVEMFCDWLAATKRHDDGDIYRSIELNQERFKYPNMFKNIFINTARFFGE